MNEDDVVWKYMDIRKLKSSIDNGGLWFSRADILRNSDPFEIEDVDRVKYENNSMGEFTKCFLKNKMFPDKIVDTLVDAAINYKCMVDVTKYFICCWHINNYESLAMWNLYANASKCGVALKTTFGKLHRALDENIRLEIKPVKYIDFSTEQQNDFIFHKHNAYSFEKELRICRKEDVAARFDLECGWLYKPRFEKGRYIKTDFSSLIDEVVVNPYVKERYVDMVKKIVSKVSPEIIVRKSDVLRVAKGNVDLNLGAKVFVENSSLNTSAKYRICFSRVTGILGARFLAERKSDTLIPGPNVLVDSCLWQSVVDNPDKYIFSFLRNKIVIKNDKVVSENEYITKSIYKNKIRCWKKRGKCNLIVMQKFNESIND